MTFSYDMFESPFFFGVVFISFWSTSDHIYFELFFFLSGCERCKGVRSEALSNGVEMTIRRISKEAKSSVTGRPHDHFWETLTAGVVLISWSFVFLLSSVCRSSPHHVL